MYTMFLSRRKLALAHVFLAAALSVRAAPFAASSAAVVSEVSPSAPASAPPVSATVAPAPDDPNQVLWTDASTGITPEAQRGTLGTNILGPQNIPLELQNADLLAPPSTDAGTV